MKEKSANTSEKAGVLKAEWKDKFKTSKYGKQILDKLSKEPKVIETI